MSSFKKDYLELIKNFSVNENIQASDLEMILRCLLEEGKKN